MSVVRMKRMSLVAHKGERSKLTALFLRSGCVEITESSVDLPSVPIDYRETEEILERKKLRVSFAMTFLRESYKDLARIDKNLVPKADFKKLNRLVPIDEYDAVAAEEVDIFSEIEEMEKLNSRLVDIKSERSRIIALREQLFPYLTLDMPFSELHDTATCCLYLGTVPDSRQETVEEGLKDIAAFYKFDSGKTVCIAAVGHKEKKKEILAVLSANDFARCPFEYDVTAKQRDDELASKLESLDREREEIIKKTATYAKFIENFKILFDYYALELSKIACLKRSPHSEKAFLMEGWVPADKAEELEKKATEKIPLCEISFRDPFDNENPPTLTENIKPVEAFSGITEMFGAPNYREQDPNIFVALFYFLFFGIMISDAGYGLLMAIACFLMVKITKPVKNSGRMLLMFGFCGISTVIWGALFGGWFGMENIGFLEKIRWFSPLDDPLKMFMLALAMGVLQIGTGFLLKGIALCKEKHYLLAVFNQFSWVIIFIGLVLISPKLMLFLGAIKTTYSWFDGAQTAGMIIAVIGFAMLLIGGGIGKKNPLKMVTGAFGNAYGAINVVSDLLSYSRLFGLGLTTGVIGLVVNMLAEIIVNTFFGGLWVGWIVAVPVLIIGHVFNIAINLLGAYVHNSRLQYIEFFGRFYEGSGRAFRPLGSDAKYTYPDN